MPGSPASKTREPFVRPPPKHPVPFTHAGMQADFAVGLDFIEAYRMGRKRFGEFRGKFPRPPGRNLLAEAVPNLAFGTFAHPFRAYIAALLASVDQFRFGHFPPSRATFYPVPSACPS